MCQERCIGYLKSRNNVAWWHDFLMWVTNTVKFETKQSVFNVMAVVTLEIQCIFMLGKIYLKNFFFYLAALSLSCGMWDLPSSLQHAASLAVACEFLVAACEI